MSTMILISSSSPPMFARDLTPGEFSPARFRPSTQSRELTSSPKRFKYSNVTRDGFSTCVSGARSTLAVKPGAENVLLQTPGKDRFKGVSSALPIRKSPPSAPRNDLPNRKKSTSPLHIHNDEPGNCASEIRTGDDALHHTTPAAREKVVMRRLDWTPVTDDEDRDLDHVLPTDERAGFMSDFGFKSTAVHQSQPQSHDTEVSATKRTRIDLVQIPGPAPIVIKATRGKGSSKAKPKHAAPKKVKAAPKKAKTITELVTSHHSGSVNTDSPIAEFLVATQAKTRDGVLPSEDDIEVATRVPKRKAGGQKTQPRKRQLLSPTSAMKAFDCQETVFGSASQLARDERRIEVDLSSDPVSPLRTQATSHGSITPHVARGSSRFVKTRNLWGAADRDEDNALLHVESIDLFDSPLVRNALAGKDALITPRVVRSNKATATARNIVAAIGSHPDAATPVMQPNRTIVDVDDFSSPALRYPRSPNPFPRPPARHFSTSARQQSTTQADEPTTKSVDSSAARIAASPKAGQPKPNYSGMQTGDLQTLIKRYGFKAIKSREKMVDLLDKCWKEKEARRALQQENQQAEALQHVVARHTDLISNVHDLSNRPQPKAKKGPRKARAAPKPKVNTEDAGTTATTAAEKPKKSRAKKTKAVLSEEKILDVDDIDDDFTHLTTLREEKTKTRQPTEPAMSLETTHESGGVQGTKVNSEQHMQRDGAVSVLKTAAQAEIGQQIHAAVLHQSEQAAEVDGWDHVRSPTWHEKILMYDPIIIEDLARWLNSEGLNGIEEDREVTTVEVRDWCESRGVCCMWKGGWRGQASKGGD